MQNSDLATLESIHSALTTVDKCVDAVVIENPAREVEISLVSFLKHRLGKLQEATSYEEDIKEVIMARIGEASFPHLLSLLEIVQKNNNIATEKVLAPFISQSGRTVTETMRDSDLHKQRPEELVYAETSDKKILQSLSALSQLMELTRSSKPGSSESGSS